SRMQAELRRDFPQVRCVPVLGDCGDPAVIRHAISRSQPEAVFHAAAYKQVPLLEFQLREAVRNNVLATETVIRECQDAGIGSFVLISADKAVDPVNVLGATKRLAEMVCQAQSGKTSTRAVTVRFGNVLDSAGSVVPLFREQIRNGGPVTVTDPEVTRYFMTIPEACQLILQAAAMGSQDAVYTLDMGEPVAIKLLAEQMIRLAGKQPERDIAIVYTGLRRARSCTKPCSTPTSATGRPRIRRSCRPKRARWRPSASSRRASACARPWPVTTWKRWRPSCAMRCRSSCPPRWWPRPPSPAIRRPWSRSPPEAHGIHDVPNARRIPTHPQGRVSRCRARHPVPAGHQDGAQGNAADRGQAADPVRG